MEPVPLKIGENDNADAFILKEFVENYSLYKADYRAYKYYQSLFRNLLIMLYLFIPAIVHSFIQTWEEVILISFLVLLAFFWKPLNKASDFLVFKTLSKIASEKAHRVKVYKKYHVLLKDSIEEVLNRGTRSYIEDVVLKIQSKPD